MTGVGKKGRSLVDSPERMRGGMKCGMNGLHLFLGFEIL